MDDCFLMYRVSPEGLRMMNYCNEVESFINYALSNMKISSSTRRVAYGIRCPCKRCENKKYLDIDVVTMHLL